MQLIYRSYSFKVNGVKVTTQQVTNLTDARVPYSVTNSLTCDGYLEGSGQSGCTTEENALRAALAVNFGDLTLKQDDGSNSATLLDNYSSLSGVVITAGPSFMDAMGPEYVNQRHFVFTAEAEYILTGSNFLWKSYEETVAYSGGGPLYIMKKALNGPPQRQLIYQQTPYIAMQTGRAVGFRSRPATPAPIWPFALMEAGSVNWKSPRRQGGSYIDWEVDWSYHHEWHAPLIGAPRLWPLTN